MKNLITTIVIAIICGLFAGTASANSILNLRVFDNRPVIVHIDGFSDGDAGTSVIISGIHPGLHVISISEPSYYTGYRQDREIYRGLIDIPSHSQITVTLTRKRKLRIESIHPTPRFTVTPAPGLQCPPLPAPVCGTHVPPAGMDETRFRDLLTTIGRVAFDDTRLEIATNAIKREKHISTAQVEHLLSLLKFDSTRLSLAKSAYVFTSDRENYANIFNAFTFESSVRELNEFIGAG